MTPCGSNLTTRFCSKQGTQIRKSGKLLTLVIFLEFCFNLRFFFRLFAITSCVEIAKKLGNDFLPLLPETIPFFAEMLEDENVDVEKACQASVQELERVLGEPLQKYF